MSGSPPPPSDTPGDEGSAPPPPRNPYGSEPTDPPPAPPPAPPNPYASQPPPTSDPYAGSPPPAGQMPPGSAPQEPAAPGQHPYGAEAYPRDPGGPTPVGGARPASLLPRFLARLIDGVLFAILSGVVGVLADDRSIGTLLGGILYLGYYVYMESSRGATLGKQWLSMRVHGSTGGNPTMEEAFRRNAWYVLGILSAIPILGILSGIAELVAVVAIAVTISQDPHKRGWHDKFASTSVTKDG